MLSLLWLKMVGGNTMVTSSGNSMVTGGGGSDGSGKPTQIILQIPSGSQLIAKQPDSGEIIK